MTDQLTDQLGAVADQTRSFLATARSIDDLQVPSMCAGWTRAHILAHIARNAEGLDNLVRAAVDGEQLTMYRSDAARDADIETGTGLDRDALLSDIETTAAALAAQLPRLRPEHDELSVERTPGGRTFRAGAIPYLRLRELVLHHVDLLSGFGFGDVEPALTARLLNDAVARLRANPHAPGVRIRTDEGDSWSIGDGTASVSGPRSGVLGWLARGLPDGVHADHLPDLPHGG